ncbi:pyruvate dehydrogenase complex dihydrolipoamide acetyltransferase [Leucobacter japonicus]|uniref:pyruvate dehydrogenase complex dihydrolipoamide acetyltransferase n=1 Tax=Leucobacter japonicus TaxID=1461259 RepID=UPI0006A77B3A|nr:pyruvate dehydrogenase complex dihydrolipoamide acetyltransferase [Leucobacter japonicus]
MAIIVRMPEIATGSAEAAIAGWLVAPGDEIQAGQAIVEIETEKATVEYEVEDGGVFAGTLLDAGAAANVGAPIAVLATGGQSIESALAEAGGPASASAGSAPADPAPEPTAAGEPRPATAPEPAGGAIDVIEADAALEVQAGERRFASPLVRKLARERGLDLSNVRGTGPHGRIVRRDLEGLAAVAPDAAPSEATTTPATATAPAAAPPAKPAPAPAPTQAAGPGGASYTDEPHTGMRRAIARRLTESKSTVPHFYLVADCRVDALLALRAQINELEGTKVSVNDFVVKAVAGALRDVPGANAIWTDDATRRFDGVDISVAVSVPGGLLTPVVRGTEALSLGALSAAIKDLAGRARDGKLKQHELEGGSFSVSNLGMYGTTQFSAILNPPQSGILAVGAATRRPVVEADGSLGVATVMTVTLSADHRVLDGALAAEWLAAFQRRIEQPMSILVS